MRRSREFGGAGVYGPLPLAIALALGDNLVRVVGEPVEGALGQHGIVEERDPLVDGPVAGHDRRRAAVALADDLVEVARLPCVEAAQAEVVNLLGAQHKSMKRAAAALALALALLRPTAAYPIAPELLSYQGVLTLSAPW